MRRLTRSLILLACLAQTGGCGSLPYYAQSTAGHLSILAARRPIERVLEDTTVPEETRSALRFVTELRAFAHDALLLPDNGSYRSYSVTGREFVVWNVFAAPELSLEPLRWCFPFAGCISYRGYFGERAALAFARRLEERGFDVFVGGVAAYSTLGWFEDPVLDTMLRRDRLELAKLIFHELAHQRVYVRGDTEFNEAFADAVALIGLQMWYAGRPDDEYRHFLQEQESEQRFFDLVLEFKARLEELYGSGRAPDEKRAAKQVLVTELSRRYAELREQDPGVAAYSAWMAREINNARFVAVSTYRELVPDFIRLYENACGNLESFYARAEDLASSDMDTRYLGLKAGEPAGRC